MAWYTGRTTFEPLGRLKGVCMNLREPLDDEWYVMERAEFERIRRAALRLYDDTRGLRGDDMRDLAQSLDVAVNRTVGLSDAEVGLLMGRGVDPCRG